METLDLLEAEIFSPALSKTPQETEEEIFPVLSFPIIYGIIQSLQNSRQRLIINPLIILSDFNHTYLGISWQ